VAEAVPEGVRVAVWVGVALEVEVITNAVPVEVNVGVAVIAREGVEVLGGLDVLVAVAARGGSYGG
jgi:hypothetical protein